MKRIVIAVVIAAVAVIGLVAYSQAKGEGGGGAAETPPLTGTTLDGQAFDLADTRGKPAVINFFAWWCPPCNEEAPDLVAFSEAHPEIAVVGVAIDDERPRRRPSWTSTASRTLWCSTPRAAPGRDWGVTGIPTTFFLDAEGAVQDTIVGAATRDQFEASLRDGSLRRRSRPP